MTEGQGASYLDPLRQEMQRVEARITELEDELAAKRKERSGLGHALRALDPQWAAEHPWGKSKPGPKGKGGSKGPSEAVVENIFGQLKERYGTKEVFSTADAAALTATHPTTVSKVVVILRNQNRVRLDHKGGPRNMTHLFRLVDG